MQMISKMSYNYKFGGNYNIMAMKAMIEGLLLAIWMREMYI